MRICNGQFGYERQQESMSKRLSIGGERHFDFFWSDSKAQKQRVHRGQHVGAGEVMHGASLASKQQTYSLARNEPLGTAQRFIGILIQLEGNDEGIALRKVWRELETQARHVPFPADAVAHRRELGRERSKRHRERIFLYGKPGDGYRVSTYYTPADVLDILANRYPAKLDGWRFVVAGRKQAVSGALVAARPQR